MDATRSPTAEAQDTTRLFRAEPGRREEAGLPARDWQKRKKGEKKEV